ncbi:hypothetical protein VNI00_015294 [Paramarasmius palmivorus]|uniref:Cupin 2 conserved barrel domain-containing protein n=1 Tax=Paramarasmius palmivorus TaxID=297713 RepID=A0AAW0BLJ2_9AGAR
MTHLLTFLIGLPLILAGLIVDVAPDSPKPYVLPNLKGSAVNFGGLVLRTLVPNSTSEGALSVVGVNVGPSPLSLIHSHKEVEAFYTIKGSVQVFHDHDTGREMRANDFTLLAPGHNHTYRMNDLDFQLTICTAHGGIDRFFAVVGDPYNSSSPFDPESRHKLDPVKVLTTMPKFNISPAPRNLINTNWINGTTQNGLSTWRIADQKLPENASTPYFISSNRGPKYLKRDSGTIIAQLASGKQTSGKLSISTITLKPGRGGPAMSFGAHQAFQVVEGQLQVEIGREMVQLIFGDLVFIPKGVEFRYWSRVGFTKFVNWAVPGMGLADRLIEVSEPWAHAVWPDEDSKAQGIEQESYTFRRPLSFLPQVVVLETMDMIIGFLLFVACTLVFLHIHYRYKSK